MKEKRRKKKGKRRKKKKRKEKKEINLIAALQPYDICLSYDIQPYEILFATLKPFLTEIAFYAKLAGWFSGSKTKVM